MHSYDPIAREGRPIAHSAQSPNPDHIVLRPFPQPQRIELPFHTDILTRAFRLAPVTTNIALGPFTLIIRIGYHSRMEITEAQSHCPTFLCNAQRQPVEPASAHRHPRRRSSMAASGGGCTAPLRQSPNPERGAHSSSPISTASQRIMPHPVSP